MLSRLCVSNGTRCLSSLVLQKQYFPFSPSWLCYVRKVAAPLSSNKTSFNVSGVRQCVYFFKNYHILNLEGGVRWGGGTPHINLYGEVLPKRVPPTIQDRLFHLTFFLSTFYMETFVWWGPAQTNFPPPHLQCIRYRGLKINTLSNTRHVKACLAGA